jgi:hypothetical protein
VGLRQVTDGVCQSAPPIQSGATECPPGWSSINLRGTWSTGGRLYTFARFPGPESAICGLDVALLDWEETSKTWTVDEVKVEAIEDPVDVWIRTYARAAAALTRSEAGRIALGTDTNGLNGLFEISDKGLPDGALAASYCPAAPGDANEAAAPLPIVPMRLRHEDGTLGAQVLLEERGLATYGLLADLLAVVRKNSSCGEQVYQSLMLSAEATIRVWEDLEGIDTRGRVPLPALQFGNASVCPLTASPGGDAGAHEAGDSDAISDASDGGASP